MTKIQGGGLWSLLAVLLLIPSGLAQKAEEKEKASIWMKKKIEYAQRLLLDVTRADFAAVLEHAKEMQFLGYLEKYDRSDIPGYKRQVSHFEAAIEELIKNAEAKSLQGVTLSFQQLTNSCVQCHQAMRQGKK